jgi:hypothetical protein
LHLHNAISKNKKQTATTDVAVQLAINKAKHLSDNRPQSILQKKQIDALATKMKDSPFQKKEKVSLSFSNETEAPFQLEEKSIANKSTTNETEAPVQRVAVAQLGKYTKIAAPAKDWKQKQKDKERLYALKPWREFDDLEEDIKKMIKRTKKYVDTVKEQIEDDDDFDWIEEQVVELDDIQKQASKTKSQIRLAPSGRSRSASGEKDTLIQKLKSYKSLTNYYVGLIYKSFPLNSGGFGAKGRAHNAMDVEVNPKVVPGGKVNDTTYFDNIHLNGVGSGHQVYKSSPRVAKEKTGPSLVAGKSETAYPNKAKTLKDLEKLIGKSIVSPQPASFTTTPASKGRGDGQYASMGNTNAAGYAALAQIPGWKTQRWEWLHIRGAGLGGATNGTNLVAGVRDANTHMIPFESNIRTLGTAVNGNKNYSQLDVIWSVAGQVAGAPHAFNTITMQWRLVKKKSTAPDHFGVAHFKPLQTGSNISKNEIDAIEASLKDMRSTV